MWTQRQAINLCILLESIVPAYGAHVALTGGNLYKHGERKDCDVLFYRIRQQPRIDMEGMWKALADAGFKKLKGWGWCYKAEYEGHPVDCFFPEEERDANGNEIEYEGGPPTEVELARARQDNQQLKNDEPEEDIAF